MGRKINESIRQIQQSGKKGSYYVTLPIKLMRKLKWRERQKLVVKEYGKGILIKDWHPAGTHPQGGNKKKKTF